VGNKFEDTFFAIYLAKAHDCVVQGNEIRGNAERESASGNGIHLWYSRDVTVHGNRIRYHRDGIYFEFVESSLVSENLSQENLRYGLHFMFSDGCRYENNEFRDNNAGVAVMYTKRVEMVGNLFADNWGSSSFGLLLKDITDSEIRYNVFLRNTVGIFVEGSNRVDVVGNELIRNGWAVKIMANSQDNTFSLNRFVANSFDVSTNSRQNYSSFNHNYWDNYKGYDLDRDGTGDVPFRPVRLFSLLVEQNEPTLILLRSLFVDLLDVAERALPVLTPQTLVDDAPLMAPPERARNVGIPQEPGAGVRD
jgi:nitrous oxidase accessory protein